MLLEKAPIEKLFKSLEAIHDKARKKLGRSLTVVEKNLFSHMEETDYSKLKRGVSNLVLQPDRVAMQDATAQMAILQFMSARIPEVAVPTSVHCDHLIQAHVGAEKDLIDAEELNGEVYDFLRAAAMKYNMGFWKPGSGIIHQVVFENYAVPGTMMLGTDSHTPNAGGLGMIAVGVGGADAVDTMTGQGFSTKMPKLVGIQLKGKLNGWASAKDIILRVTTMLTVKGGTGKVVEYFGEGARAMSATGKGTVTNMGAEIGATTSTFGYDENMDPYLRATDRAEIADLCKQFAAHLQSDPEVEKDPEKFYDEVYEIDLATLEPHIVGPHTPDLGRPVSAMAAEVGEKGYPEELSAALIGSCTNASYEDMSRSVSLVRQARDAGVKVKSVFLVTPGSERVYETIKQDGILKDFEDVGATVLANACGPCIGKWKREDKQKGEANSILTSYNRNFAKRNDGNPNTHAFVGSPELVTALAIAGDLTFDPARDTLINADGQEVKLDPPLGVDLPENGFAVEDLGYQEPVADGCGIEVVVNLDSERLELLAPFDPWNGNNITGMKLLIKAKGKCTTDHISMAGPWLRFRGHLDNISNNMLTGAINYYNEKANNVKNQLTGDYGAVPDVQRAYKAAGVPTIVVGDENYGEGSSREHAAMEPRHLGVRVVLVRSFARIHETNLKKQGMLALTFAEKSDYDKIQENDTFDFTDLDQFSPGKPLTLNVTHYGGSTATIMCNHTCNQTQIDWFKAGSALNLIRSQ